MLDHYATSGYMAIVSSYYFPLAIMLKPDDYYSVSSIAIAEYYSRHNLESPWSYANQQSVSR